MARGNPLGKEWVLIAPLLPNKPRGQVRVDDRLAFNALFWWIRVGGP